MGLCTENSAISQIQRSFELLRIYTLILILHVVLYPKCEKGFAVTVVAVLKPVNRSKKCKDVYLIVQSNSTTAFEIGMMADRRIKDGSFTFVAETGLHALKGKDLDFS